MKPVLVTGGAGYIGSHTVQELRKEGVPVVVLDNLSTGHRQSVQDISFYEGDIADAALVEDIIQKHGIKSIIHFAAKSQVGESLQKPELYFHENTVKTFNLLNTAFRAGIEQVVFSSTAAVYGIPDRVPISENEILNPINPYGSTKRMIEDYLGWIGRIHGIKWIALRYFNAAGASLDGSIGEDHRPESHLIPLVMQTALGLRSRMAVYGADYDTPDGSCIRDYIHVIDLARAHLLALNALEQDMPSRCYNVGTGRGYSVLEVIEKARLVTGINFNVEYEDQRTGDPPILVAESSLIKNDLGWQPEHSDLETILSSAWRWHNSHPQGYEA